jgi:hypothetical protein
MGKGSMHLSQSSEIAEIIASYATTFFDIKSVQESHLQTRYGNFLLPPIVDPYLFLLSDSGTLISSGKSDRGHISHFFSLIVVP